MKEALAFLLLIFPATTSSSRLAISLPGCPDKCVRCAFTGLLATYASKSNTTPTDNYTEWLDLKSTPFIPSIARNRFTVIGCNVLGFLGGSNPDPYVSGCYTYCQGINSTSDGESCSGNGCCESTIPPNLTLFGALFVMNLSLSWNFNPCFYAMLAEVGWYSFRKQDLVGHLGFIKERAKKGVPLVNDWAIRNGSCPKDGDRVPRDHACVSSNSYCVSATNGPGYMCNCSQGYEGNPYLHNGCQDIDECKLRKQDPKYAMLYPCKKGVCHNTPGGYICRCRAGTRSDGTNFGCQPVLGQTEQVAVVLEKLAELVTRCLSPRGDERPTMKEVAERLQILRRLHMQLRTKINPITTRHSDCGPSTSGASDETTYQGMETANLVLDADVAIE
ncbi:hypothetical protein EJB05_00340, partial [Eragrostis curvula]